jgi:hypothetical protein
MSGMRLKTGKFIGAGIFILVLLIILILAGSTSCSRNSLTLDGDLFLRMRFSGGEKILYRMAISGSGTMKKKSHQTGKQEVIKENMNITGELVFQGIDSKTAHMEWKLRNSTLGEGMVNVFLPKSLVIDESGRCRENVHGYDEMLALIFLLPEDGTDFGGTWLFERDEGSKGKSVIKSKMGGEENYGDRTCVKIYTEFDIHRNVDGDTFKIKGSGLSYFSREEGRFIAVERKYSLASSIQDFENKSLQMEQSGTIALELTEDNSAR